MKVIKCDRCGKKASGYFAFGIDPFYYGSIIQYLPGGEISGHNKLDLCGECQSALDALVNNFLKQDKE